MGATTARESGRLAATADPAARLRRVDAAHGRGGVAALLAGVDGAAETLAAVEGDLRALAGGPRVAAAAARHLVEAGGKRVRPALCLLACHAARAGAPAPAALARARALATAAEAIHAATLLHDDVIDLGDTRRGVPTARVVYGNSASVLGGDLLLVRALSLVAGARPPGGVASVVAVLERMIAAEAHQLERRGSAELTEAEYFEIVAGKTASLFEWAAWAGASAAAGASAGAASPAAAALARYGLEVGIAFQVMDDLLDLVGDPGAFGKGLLADVREGKATYPLIHALRAAPALRAPLEAAARGETLDLAALGAEVRAAAERAGGIAAARAEVERRTARAEDALAALPDTPARGALAALARAMAERTR